MRLGWENLEWRQKFVTLNCVRSAAVASVDCHIVPCCGDRRALGRHEHGPHAHRSHNGLHVAPTDQLNSFHRLNIDPEPERQQRTFRISTRKMGNKGIRLLDGVLELARAVHNCYSKRRLVNFYSLVNYIHLQPQTREKC